MQREELKRLIFGPMGAVPTPFDNALRPDLAAVTDLIQWYLECGVTAGMGTIKVCGAVDPYNLDEDEWAAVVGAAVRAAAGKATVLCGMKPKNTQQSIQDARRAQDLGVAGVQMDLPFFNFPTQDDYVRFFSAVSEAVEIGIMVKNCFWFGAASMTADTLLRLGETEHVVATKWDVPAGEDYDAMRRFAGVINVIDDSSNPVRCHKNGGRGYVDGWLLFRPQHSLKLWSLLEAGRYDEAQALFDEYRNVIGAFNAGALARSGGDRVSRGILTALGFPVGDPRPPTIPLDEAEMAALRQIMAAAGWLERHP
jgi:4-hydroxy-tetrahydrodipicolinate synthase